MRLTTTIPLSRATEFLRNETQGRIFTLYFTKKDRTVREMRARRGVKSYRRGGSLPYNPDDKGLIIMFDMQAREYRAVNVASLISFNIGGETFIVV